MKKTGRIVFSMLVASGLSVLSSSAQTHYSSNVSVGVKGGVDLSRVSFTPSVKQGFAVGEMQVLHSDISKRAISV